MEQLFKGNCLDILPRLEGQSVQCCVTSPPYWGLRDYGTAKWEGGDAECDHLQVSGIRQDVGRVQVNGFHGSAKQSVLSDKPFRDLCEKCGARRIDSQLGLEATPEEYVANMVAVFREVKRVLRDDGVLFLNLGDSYAGKNLCGIPWRIAFALQGDGWILRSDIVWAKPNPMPESVTDRPTKSHEYIFLLTKQERYFYDAEAIKESVTGNAHPRGNNQNPKRQIAEFGVRSNSTFSASELVDNRNKRTVWTIPTQPYSEAHFATFPEELPKLCILAGSKPGDLILDPFAGSGTVGKVALELGRTPILIELNSAYETFILDRTNVTKGWF